METAVNSVNDYQNRRYVGTKEAVAYVLDDISQSFNINSQKTMFVTDVLKIGLDFQKVVVFVRGIWDIINDLFLAAIIDKTRTRWGKFKPWLVIYAFVGVAITSCFWAMPLMFKSSGLYDVPKLATYMALNLLLNLAESTIQIARTGMTATITPNINERTKLITQANLFSGFVEKLPGQIIDLLVDLISHKVIKIKFESLFASAGLIVTAVSGFFALSYALVAKERVMQTEEKPSIKTGIKSIIYNKPLLLITLSEFLGAFNVDQEAKLYYRNVLGFSSMTNIVGIPGAFVSPMSYTYVPWARRKFSTKTLWIAGSHVDSILLSLVFVAGSINKGYKKLGVMIPAWMLRETIWMFFYGIKKVIPEEMRNEAIDYGEWKNGYRSEGMTGVTKGIAAKLVETFGSTIETAILAKIGYVQGGGYGGQSEKTEFMLFALCTTFPAVSGLLSIIPKCFYDLNGEKRDRMYQELNERRIAVAKQAKELDSAENGEE